MSQLEDIMVSLMNMFDKYAGAGGNKDTLSKGEVAEMLKKEFPALAQEPKNKGQVDEMFNTLDLNGDAEVDFSEFMTIVGVMTCLVHGRCTKM